MLTIPKQLTTRAFSISLSRLHAQTKNKELQLISFTNELLITWMKWIDRKGNNEMKFVNKNNACI